MLEYQKRRKEEAERDADERRQEAKREKGNVYTDWRGVEAKERQDAWERQELKNKEAREKIEHEQELLEDQKRRKEEAEERTAKKEREKREWEESVKEAIKDGTFDNFRIKATAGDRRKTQEMAGLKAKDNGDAWAFNIGWKTLMVKKDHPRIDEITEVLAKANQAFDAGDEEAGDKFLSQAARIEQGK